MMQIRYIAIPQPVRGLIWEFHKLLNLSSICELSVWIYTKHNLWCLISDTTSSAIYTKHYSSSLCNVLDLKLLMLYIEL
jgi:hypothetical protein